MQIAGRLSSLGAQMRELSLNRVARGRNDARRRIRVDLRDDVVSSGLLAEVRERRHHLLESPQAVSMQALRLSIERRNRLTVPWQDARPGAVTECRERLKRREIVRKGAIGVIKHGR